MQGPKPPYVGHEAGVSPCTDGFMEQESNRRRDFSYFAQFIDLSRRRLEFPERLILRGEKIEVEQNKIRTKHDVMGKSREKPP